MSSGEVTKDGETIPPLNITNPAPSMNLKGFQWQAIEPEGPLPESIKPAQVGDDKPPTDQAAIIDGHKPILHQRVADPQPSLRDSAAVKDLTQETLLDADLFPLEAFKGSFAGNGFNMIWRPRPFDSSSSNDNILELNLTTEQWTFAEPLGNIPNRGFGSEKSITLGGIPYQQTVQDVLNTDTGKGNKLVPRPIHFEPGVWLTVPKNNVHNTPSVVRMASIPHGTTINAQGPKPSKNVTKDTPHGGEKGKPDFDLEENKVDTTPIHLEKGNKRTRMVDDFAGPGKPMDATQPNTFRIPRDLSAFTKKETSTITSEIIKNPNLVLKKAIDGLTILETLTISTSTGLPDTKATMNGGGTTNIAFLAGKQNGITTLAPSIDDSPNAHAELMTSKFWIEHVEYDVNVPVVPKGGMVVNLRATLPPNSTAPTPVFAVKTPKEGVPQSTKIRARGVQIQYSQTVNLTFGPPGFMITWPHVSVATLVPNTPQPASV